MSFIAEILIDGTNFNEQRSQASKGLFEGLEVLECDYALTQDIDHAGKPQAATRGGIISILVPSTKSTDFFSWAVSSTQTKSGSIRFFRRDGMSTLKILHFKDAYCVGYRERFTSVGPEPMATELVLSAREIRLGDDAHVNKWEDSK